MNFKEVVLELPDRFQAGIVLIEYAVYFCICCFLLDGFRNLSAAYFFNILTRVGHSG